MLTKFSAEQIPRLEEGRVGAVIDHAFGIVSRDIMDRPGHKGARKVVITAIVEPVVDQQGRVKGMDCKWQAQAKIPIHETAGQQMRIEDCGETIMFDEYNPSIDQMGIHDEIERKESEDNAERDD